MVLTMFTKNAISSIKTKNCLFQWICVIIESLPFLIQGLQFGWVSPIKPLPHTQDVGIQPDLQPWIVSSVYLAASLSSPIMGYLNDLIGRKRSIFLISLIQFVSWCLLLNKNNEKTVIASRIFTGIATAGVFITIPTYLREISKDRYRGITISFGIFVLSLGYALLHVLGSCMAHNNVIFAVLCICVMHIILTLSVVETPAFYVKIGKFEEAAQSASLLQNKHVEDIAIVKYIERLRNESDKVTYVQGNMVFKIFKNPVWRNALKIGLVLQTVRPLGGKYIIFDNVKLTVLARSKSDLDTHMQMAIPIILILSSVVSTVLVEKIGRRILLTVSSSCMAISLGILAVFMQTDLTFEYYDSMTWLPITVLVTSLIGYGLGFFAIPFVVMTEVSNFEIRSTVLSIVMSYSWLLSFIQCYTFNNLEDYLGLDALLYIYAGISIYGAVYSLFGIPETTRRSIQRIEKELEKTPLLKL